MPTISMNAYPLGLYMKHFGYQGDLLSKFILVKASGADTLEIGTNTLEGVVELAGYYEQFHMESKACVLGGNLFESGWEAEVEKIVTVAAAFRERLGTPLANMCLSWKPNPEGTHPEAKNDEELEVQGKAYAILIQELATLGMETCFHMHDIELKEDWKEIRAMAKLNPGMKFCMDVQWIHQGSGYSMDAVRRFMDDYGTQIVHLHLRQTTGEALQDTFRLEGDIDYRDVFARLKQVGYAGNLSLEQTESDANPKTVRPFAVTAAEGLDEIRAGWSEAGLS